MDSTQKTLLPFPLRTPALLPALNPQHHNTRLVYQNPRGQAHPEHRQARTASTSNDYSDATSTSVHASAVAADPLNAVLRVTVRDDLIGQRLRQSMSLDATSLSSSLSSSPSSSLLPLQPQPANTPSSPAATTQLLLLTRSVSLAQLRKLRAALQDWIGRRGKHCRLCADTAAYLRLCWELPRLVLRDRVDANPRLRMSVLAHFLNTLLKRSELLLAHDQTSCGRGVAAVRAGGDDANSITDIQNRSDINGNVVGGGATGEEHARFVGLVVAFLAQSSIEEGGGNNGSSVSEKSP